MASIGSVNYAQETINPPSEKPSSQCTPFSFRNMLAVAGTIGLIVSIYFASKVGAALSIIALLYALLTSSCITNLFSSKSVEPQNGEGDPLELETSGGTIQMTRANLRRSPSVETETGVESHPAPSAPEAEDSVAEDSIAPEMPPKKFPATPRHKDLEKTGLWGQRIIGMQNQIRELQGDLQEARTQITTFSPLPIQEASLPITGLEDLLDEDPTSALTTTSQAVRMLEEFTRERDRIKTELALHRRMLQDHHTGS